MIGRRKGLRGPVGSVVLSSGLSWLLWPPLHLMLPSFVCLVPALTALLDADGPRRRFVLGAVYGALGMAGPLYWMCIGMLRFRPLFAAFFPVVVLLGIAYGGSLFAVTGWIRERTHLPLWAIFPFTWTSVEWLVGHMGPIAFPWLGLGTSLTAYPQLVQIADAMGARGVTLLLAMANAALATGWVARRTRPSRILAPALAVATGILVAAGYGAMRMLTLPLRPSLRVAVLEPNHGVRDRWQSDSQDSLARDLVVLSEQAVAAARPDLVVWPENALPADLGSDRRFFGLVTGLARRTGTTILAGVLERRMGPDGRVRQHNAAQLIMPEAAPRIVYRKRFLIPAAEEGLGGLVAGEAVQSAVRLAGADLGVLICHESTREDLARAARMQGADVLVNLVNDSWFDGTVAPAQFAAHLVMRAIETRAGIVRSANSSPAQIVDPLGRVTASTDPRTRGWTSGVVLTVAHPSLYATVGDWVGALSLAATSVLAVMAFALGIAPFGMPARATPGCPRPAPAG